MVQGKATVSCPVHIAHQMHIRNTVNYVCNILKNPKGKLPRSIILCTVIMLKGSRGLGALARKSIEHRNEHGMEN